MIALQLKDRQRSIEEMVFERKIVLFWNGWLSIETGMSFVVPPARPIDPHVAFQTNNESGKTNILVYIHP